MGGLIATPTTGPLWYQECFEERDLFLFFFFFHNKPAFRSPDAFPRWFACAVYSEDTKPFETLGDARTMNSSSYS